MRLVLAILAGIVVAFICVLVLETIGHLIYPPPADMDLSDPEALKTLMSDIPLGAKVAVLIAWFVATIVGGLVAARIARRGAWPAWCIAGFMGLMIAINLIWIPHPTWMVIAAVVLTVLGGAIAARLATRPIT